jgi:hypothetical protein
MLNIHFSAHAKKIAATKVPYENFPSPVKQILNDRFLKTLLMTNKRKVRLRPLILIWDSLQSNGHTIMALNKILGG